MARRRYISTEISTDPKLARLAQHGTLPMLLYTWAIPHMDDWGRISGDPVEFKLAVCPGLNVTEAEVQEAIEQIAAVGLWMLYSADGKTCIAIPEEKWFRYQTYIAKEKRGDNSGSKLPAPPIAAKPRQSPKKAASPSPSPSPSPKGEGAKESTDVDVLSPDAVGELWNEVCGGTLPRVSKLTPKREKHTRSRLREPGRDLAWWRDYFGRIVASSFCGGANDRQWRADYDWAVRSEDVVARVLEGRFDDARPASAAQAVVKPPPAEPEDPFAKTKAWLEACYGTSEFPVEEVPQ